MLRRKQNWILKVSPESEGDTYGAIFAVFFQASRPAGGQCAARFDGDFVHRASGHTVRRPDVQRHGTVRQNQDGTAADGVGFGPWSAEYLQPRLSLARSAGFRQRLPSVHADLCGERAGRRRARRQGAQARLRQRQKPHAADHGYGLGCADPHGFGQRVGGGQQRSSRCPAAHWTVDLEGLCGHRRCTALSPCDGGRDCRAGRRLCDCGQGQPACFAA